MAKCKERFEYKTCRGYLLEEDSKNEDAFKHPQKKNDINRTKEPCIICENYIAGNECDNAKCPVYIMKKEVERLKTENDRLRLEMSYMVSPNRIGDSHEMGAW